jgi:hypothetical protein
MCYLCYFCLLVYGSVQHIVLCFCFVFLCLVCPMLPVSLDCSFLITPSVFSNVYLVLNCILLILSEWGDNSCKQNVVNLKLLTMYMETLKIID